MWIRVGVDVRARDMVSDMVNAMVIVRVNQSFNLAFVAWAFVSVSIATS